MKCTFHSTNFLTKLDKTYQGSHKTMLIGFSPEEVVFSQIRDDHTFLTKIKSNRLINNTFTERKTIVINAKDFFTIMPVKGEVSLLVDGPKLSLSDRDTYVGEIVYEEAKEELEFSIRGWSHICTISVNDFYSQCNRFTKKGLSPLISVSSNNIAISSSEGDIDCAVILGRTRWGDTLASVNCLGTVLGSLMVFKTINTDGTLRFYRDASSLCIEGDIAHLGKHYLLLPTG